ncbi:rhodanese-like domain-containing protein [bacterium]|nr:rhodanese-like domain-containing protein [bacterium]NCQ55883.1 rhodanese-like domain-containing protein [Candidatus Parcubacteria bacterium]NCS67591.1 rhodanese-like domain-containing protein [Candidatus Peregrinibacteria bacterium]NCS96244.1 rhodanese-like domain-containing protein [bacterium]
MNWYELTFIILQYLALPSWVALPFVLFFAKPEKLKKQLLGVILSLNFLFAGFIIFNQINVPQSTEEPLSGDYWDIETVFQADTDVTSRVWKRNILKELSNNLNAYRQSQNLDLVDLGTVESFSPNGLNLLLEKYPETQLLDVRENYEFEGYGIPGAFHFRYGDLANDQIPKLDKTKRVVLICYSGLRGYLMANLLKAQGFEKVAFIRGGLEAWYGAGLPAKGAFEDFEFLSSAYNRLSLNEVENLEALKIDFRINALISSFTFPNTKAFNSELQTTAQVRDFIDSLRQESVVLLCDTESECYDARMFAYTYEQMGGNIIGYYEF